MWSFWDTVRLIFTHTKNIPSMDQQGKLRVLVVYSRYKFI